MSAAPPEDLERAATLLWEATRSLNWKHDGQLNRVSTLPEWKDVLDPHRRWIYEWAARMINEIRSGTWDRENERGFPCTGYADCENRVDDEDAICQPCLDRNDSENAGGCPGCGGSCARACR